MSQEAGEPRFSPGLDLSRRFFEQAVEPLIADIAPGLQYAAALIGDGSEVLGFDDAISSDHDWGPRVLLFVSPGDFRDSAAAILAALDARLPERFDGWRVRFEDTDRFIGVDPDAGLGGSAAHGVEIHVLGGWLRRELGADFAARDPSAAEWAAMDEQKVLAVTAGAVFLDDLGELGALRGRLHFFPLPIRLEKLARLWSEVAAEAPFVGRAGDAGDDLGSRLIAARLAEKAVRIGLLIDGRYAPYSKWLGSAFARTPSGAAIGPHVDAALAASEWRNREAALAEAFAAAARHHRESGLPGAVEPRIANYFSRPYRVINADEIAAALRRAAAS